MTCGTRTPAKDWRCRKYGMGLGCLSLASWSPLIKVTKRIRYKESVVLKAESSLRMRRALSSCHNPFHYECIADLLYLDPKNSIKQQPWLAVHINTPHIRLPASPFYTTPSSSVFSNTRFTNLMSEVPSPQTYFGSDLRASA
jgi:hypothetical protein